MNKRNAALEAIGRPASPAANVVTLPTELAPAAATPVADPTAMPKVDDRAKVMLYLHPKVARKFKEIAFIENRKMHEVYLDALDQFLTQQGHGGLKTVIER